METNEFLFHKCGGGDGKVISLLNICAFLFSGFSAPFIVLDREPVLDLYYVGLPFHRK